MRFTKTAIDALQPTTTEFFKWDDLTPGFGVRVHPTGRKVWVIRYRTESGTQRKMTIGKLASMNLDDARAHARTLLAEASKGGDPMKARQDRRDDMTLTELSEKFTIYRSGRVKEGTKENHKSLWRRILPELGGVKVRDLSFDDVEEFHSRVGEDTPVNANRCVALIRAAMNFAMKKGWREKHTNPCAEIEMFPEKERQRIVRPDEMPRLLKAIDEYTTERGCWSPRYAIKLLLLTGLRRSEWALSEWDWVDWENGTLELPDSKTGARTIHLSTATLDLLREIRGKTNSRFIIPSINEARPMRGLSWHWYRIRKEAGLDDVRIHDLRHTVGTMAHFNGLSQRDIADLLGHRKLSTSARYINNFDARKKAAADIASQAIFRAGNSA
jgi:integrase